jgi:hypothetical protein
MVATIGLYDNPTPDDGWVTFYVLTHGPRTIVVQKRDGATRTVIR